MRIVKGVPVLTDEDIDALSLGELMELHENVGARIERLRAAGRAQAITKARALIEKYGIEPLVIFGADWENGQKPRKRAAQKYSDLSAGKDWDGIGKTPRWVVGKSARLIKFPNHIG